jgi:hypothetical protein
MTREISFDTGSIHQPPSAALMPAYLEAAWALTLSDYTGSDSVTFGYVLSGRDSYPTAETTFGPTLATVPLQVHLRRNMTIQQLVTGRATSRREMSRSLFQQYGLANIRNCVDDEVLQTSRACSTFCTNRTPQV